MNGPKRIPDEPKLPRSSVNGPELEIFICGAAAVNRLSTLRGAPILRYGHPFGT
jgi:hypothetical protein